MFVVFFLDKKNKPLLFYGPSSTTLSIAVKKQNPKPTKQKKTGERDKLGTLRQTDDSCEREGDVKARVHTHSAPQPAETAQFHSHKQA